MIVSVQVIMSAGICYAAVSGYIVEVIPERQVAREGQEVVIQCRAQGSPTPILRWSRIRGVMPSTASDDGRGRLTFTQVAVSDQGSYKCEVRGGPGTFEATAQLNVEPCKHKLLANLFSYCVMVELLSNLIQTSVALFHSLLYKKNKCGKLIFYKSDYSSFFPHLNNL